MDWYSICEALNKIPMSPVFEIGHYVLMTINMRKEFVNSVSFAFERKHPLASWLATMMLCFSGGILKCFLFGKPLATLFMNPEKIAAATAVWYLVNYVPGVFGLLTTKPLFTIIIGMKEIHRIYGVYDSVILAKKDYPPHYLIHFISGFLAGTAGEILMFFVRLSAGITKPNAHQYIAPNVFLFPSSVFKTTAVLSLTFCLEAMSIIRVDHSILFASLIVVCLYVRTSMIWGIMGDPFVPLENLFCSIVFGGMWEAYQRVVRSGNQKNNNSASNGELHYKAKKS